MRFGGSCGTHGVKLIGNAERKRSVGGQDYDSRYGVVETGCKGVNGICVASGELFINTVMSSPLPHKGGNCWLADQAHWRLKNALISVKG